MPMITKVVDVNAVATYPTEANLLFENFTPDEVVFTLEAAVAKVAISTNGIDDGLVLIREAGTPTGCETVKLQSGHGRYWVRKISGPNPLNVRISASTFRG